MNTIPKKLGRYQIIREIGRGAMGVVYKAYDPVIEREVALKAIQISFQVTEEEKSVYLSRFYREAKAAGKLNHAGIVTIYDVDEDKETAIPFIVMEFLEGTTLQEVVNSGVMMPVEDVHNIMLQLADALDYAHSQGVVHRDIKSANILILEGMKTKITDFGIARLSTSELTRSGQFIGTPNYMSPEQIDGRQVDGRSDLFSLGVIFYMLLTGERPFPGDSFNTVSYKIVHVDPLLPKVINPSVPEPYGRIALKLLAKDPAQRYQTGGELVEELKKLNIPKVETRPEEKLAVMVAEAVRIEAQNESSQKQDRASSGMSFTNLTRQEMNRLIPLAGLIVLAAGVAAVSLYFLKSPQQTQPPRPVSARPGEPVSSSNPDSSLQALSKQNTIRIKWDLAVNYYQNGLYDRSIEELNAILQIDPAHQEARKYMELVKGKKTLEEAKKLEVPKPASSKPIPETVSKKRTNSRPLAPVSPAKEKTIPVPVVEPEVKKLKVNFELEHNLPSGNFYVYLNDKLVHDQELTVTEKKVLFFRSYKGKLAGALDLPVGEVRIKFQIVCKELGITAYKTIDTILKETDTTGLKIKFIRNSRQLQVKWT